MKDKCCEHCYYEGDLHENSYGVRDPNTTGCSNEKCRCHSDNPTPPKDVEERTDIRPYPCSNCGTGEYYTQSEVDELLTTYTDKRVREEREKQNGEWVLQLEDWIERLENLKKYLQDNK